VTDTKPLTRKQRETRYRRQTGASELTPAQRRRARKKENQALRGER
jgi:hypothetical protein